MQVNLANSEGVKMMTLLEHHAPTHLNHRACWLVCGDTLVDSPRGLAKGIRTPLTPWPPQGDIGTSGEIADASNADTDAPPPPRPLSAGPSKYRAGLPGLTRGSCADEAIKASDKNLAKLTFFTQRPFSSCPAETLTDGLFDRV
jgi:hypothetical protein